MHFWFEITAAIETGILSITPLKGRRAYERYGTEEKQQEEAVKDAEGKEGREVGEEGRQELGTSNTTQPGSETPASGVSARYSVLPI